MPRSNANPDPGPLPLDLSDVLLAAEDVGDLFGVSSKTVARWAEEERLPSRRTLGNHRRFLMADVWEAARGPAGDAVLPDPREWLASRAEARRARISGRRR